MSSLNKLYEKYNKHGFEIIALTTEPKQKVEKYLYQGKIGRTISYPISPNARNFWGVQAIPMMYLVGVEGTVVWEGRDKDQSLVNAIEQQIKKRNKRYASRPGDVGRAGRFYVQGQPGKAFNILKEMNPKDEKIKSAAQALRNEIKADFEQNMSRVNDLVKAGNVQGALSLLDTIKTGFRNSPFEEHIQKRGSELKSKQFAEAREASKLFLKIKQLASKNDEKARGKAIEGCQLLLDEYPDTKIASKVKTIKNYMEE